MPPPPQLTVLRQHAAAANPASLPPTVLFAHTDTTVTVFDAYPKSIFHLLVLPRTPALGSEDELASLQSALKTKDRARAVLAALTEAADAATARIRDEMHARYGWAWRVRAGFHAVPSMLHLHLHVMSDDLLGPALKNKKHYNSFHPTRGFWLPLDNVRAWLDADDAYFSRMARLPKDEYEPILKKPLTCFRCDRELKNIPVLREHLQAEWDTKEKRELQMIRSRLKRKAEEGLATDSQDEKKAKHDAEVEDEAA